MTNTLNLQTERDADSEVSKLPYIRLFVAMINQAIEDLDAHQSSVRESAHRWLFTDTTREWGLHYVLTHIDKDYRIEYIRDLARRRETLPSIYSSSSQS